MVHSEVKIKRLVTSTLDVLYCLTDRRLTDGTFTANSVSAAIYCTNID